MNLFFGEEMRVAKEYWEWRENYETPLWMKTDARPIPSGGLPWCVKYGNQKLYGRNGLWRKYV